MACLLGFEFLCCGVWDCSGDLRVFVCFKFALCDGIIVSCLIVDYGLDGGACRGFAGFCFLVCLVCDFVGDCWWLCACV